MAPPMRRAASFSPSSFRRWKRETRICLHEFTCFPLPPPQKNDTKKSLISTVFFLGEGERWKERQKKERRFLSPFAS